MGSCECDVECEVCGDPVEIDGDTVHGVIIEYNRFLLPERSKVHGFCEAHKPDDVEAVKQRIKEGRDPVPGDG